LAARYRRCNFWKSDPKTLPSMHWQAEADLQA
jgi:hypothetical protein